MCDRVGIKCDYVRGIVYTDSIRSGSGGKHAWNVVYVDGQEIPVDVTWIACNKNSDWFGKSEHFKNQHITDSDEIQYEYSLPDAPNLNEIYNSMNSVITSMKQKGYYDFLPRLELYLQTGEKDKITRFNDARTIIENLPNQEIENYLTNLRIVQNAIQTMDAKGYNGVDQIKAYLEKGKISYITSTNGCRENIQKIPKDLLEILVMNI